MKPAPLDEARRLLAGTEGVGDISPGTPPAPPFPAKGGSSDILKRLRMATSDEGRLEGSNRGRRLLLLLLPLRTEEPGVAVVPADPTTFLLSVASRAPSEDRLSKAWLLSSEPRFREWASHSFARSRAERPRWFRMERPGLVGKGGEREAQRGASIGHIGQRGHKYIDRVAVGHTNYRGVSQICPFPCLSFPALFSNWEGRRAGRRK